MAGFAPRSMHSISRGMALGSAHGGACLGNETSGLELSLEDVTGSQGSMLPVELWGGHECTVNRVGDAFFDQTVRSGHQARIDDLDRFAALGVKALRYPVLWERVAPERPGTFDWRWTDGRLARLRDLGVRPIAGLLHHGSGP